MVTDTIKALPTRCTPDFLSNLVKILQSPAAIFNRQGMIKHLNPAWSGGLSVPASTFAQLFDRRDRAEISSFLTNLDEDTGASSLELRLENGRWTMVSVQFLECEDGVPLWLATASDIHDTKSVSSDLAANNQIQQMLLNVSGDCIKLLDTHGQIQYINDAGCRALNIDPKQGFGQEWIKLLPRDAWPQAENALEQALSGETARFTGPSHGENGQLEIWDSLLTPKREADGTVSAILCISRDVTQSHSVAEELRRSQKRLAIASRVGKLGIWELELTTGNLYCDPTWYEVMGRSPSKQVHKIGDFLAMLHPEDAAAKGDISQIAAALMEAGDDYTREFRVIRDDGGLTWIRAQAAVISDMRGNPLRAVGYSVDITHEQSGK